MFKTWNGFQRVRPDKRIRWASVGCPLAVRWYPVCPVLIRSTFGSHPVDTRSRQVESGGQRTTNGHVTVKTVWNRWGPFAKRTTTDRERSSNEYKLCFM